MLQRETTYQTNESILKLNRPVTKNQNSFFSCFFFFLGGGDGLVFLFVCLFFGYLVGIFETEFLYVVLVVLELTL